MLTKNVDPAGSARLVSGRVIAKLCPKCFSPNVRRSRRRSVEDFLVILLLRRPYRCRMCRHRYMQFVFGERIRGRDFASVPVEDGESIGFVEVTAQEGQSQENESQKAQSQKA